jgi:arginine utilization regulatory protein
LPGEWQSRFAETIRHNENPDFPRLIVGFPGDPHSDVQAQRLLAELYYAVSSVTIAIPPLRERLAELPRFMELFLERARLLQPHSIKGAGSEAMNVLRAYAWPENLRELQAVLQDACRRAKGERIELADLPFHLKHGALPVERRLPLDRLLEQVERRLIALALKLTDGNQTRTAELLEIWRPRLLRRMEKLGLDQAR